MNTTCSSLLYKRGAGGFSDTTYVQFLKEMELFVVFITTIIFLTSLLPIGQNGTQSSYNQHKVNKHQTLCSSSPHIQPPPDVKGLKNL